MRGNRWTIYFPSKTGPYDRDWGFPIRYLSPIPRDRCKLHAAWCPIPNARGALLHFHGNRGNITHSFDLVPAFHRMGLSVFLLDYRGFGKSEGRPSIRGILQDARAAYECVTHELAIPPSRIVLLGDSLGGGVAIHLAGRVPCAAVVIQSTFTSIPDLAGAHMRRFRWLRFFMRNRLPNLQAVRRVRAPKLFVHSVDDEVVPFWMGRRLYEVAHEPKEFVELSRAQHHEIARSEIYLQRLDAFLSRVL